MDATKKKRQNVTDGRKMVVRVLVCVYVCSLTVLPREKRSKRVENLKRYPKAVLPANNNSTHGRVQVAGREDVESGKIAFKPNGAEKDSQRVNAASKHRHETGAVNNKDADDDDDEDNTGRRAGN